MSDLTEMATLEAVSRAIAPRSLYIADKVQLAHSEYVRAGGKGHPPTVGLILRRLRSLERAGLLICVGGPDGYYGYEWRITEAGRLALRQQESRTS